MLIRSSLGLVGPPVWPSEGGPCLWGKCLVGKYMMELLMDGLKGFPADNCLVTWPMLITSPVSGLSVVALALTAAICVNFKLMFSWYFRFCAYLTCAVLIRLLEGFFFSFLFSIRYFQTRAGYPLCTCVRASNWSKLFFVWNENLNPSYEFAHQLCIRNKWIIKKITLTCRSSVDQSGIKNKRTKTGTLVFAVQFSFTCSLMGAVDASLSLPCAVMSPGDWSLTACCKCHFQLGLCKCEDVDHKKWICCCNTYFYNVFNKIIKTELCTVFFSE